MGYLVVPPSDFNKMGLITELKCSHNHYLQISSGKEAGLDSICNYCVINGRKYENIYVEASTILKKRLDPLGIYIHGQASVTIRDDEKWYILDFQDGFKLFNNRIVAINQQNGKVKKIGIEVDESKHFRCTNSRDLQINKFFPKSSNNYLVRVSHNYLKLFGSYGEKVEQVIRLLLKVYLYVLESDSNKRVLVSDAGYLQYSFANEEDVIILSLLPDATFQDVFNKMEIPEDQLTEIKKELSLYKPAPQFVELIINNADLLKTNCLFKSSHSYEAYGCIYIHDGQVLVLVLSSNDKLINLLKSFGTYSNINFKSVSLHLPSGIEYKDLELLFKFINSTINSNKFSVNQFLDSTHCLYRYLIQQNQPKTN